jgi:RNA polymerase sigma-70 factor, ECF subfamily
MDRQEDIKNIWDAISSGLKSFILSRVNNEADASDILQDTYLKVHVNIHKLKDTARIKPWIYQITRNLIIDYYRAGIHGKPDAGQLHDLSGTASDVFMDIAVQDMIRMMENLSPEYCEALCLTELEGLSQKEFAERKGLSYSGAKSRVQRARVMLKDLLMKCCHYQFDKYGTVFDIQPKCCCCCDTGNKT